MKTADIFPIDVDLGKPISFLKRLRPEFSSKLKFPLSCDAFMSTVESEEGERDDLEVVEAGKYLRDEYLRGFVDLFQQTKIVPIDSSSLSEVIF